MLKDLLMKNEKLCLLCKEGSQGATVMSSHYEKHEDAFTETDQLRIVDTTGAGDTFTAAYAITSDLKFA